MALNTAPPDGHELATTAAFRGSHDVPPSERSDGANLLAHALRIDSIAEGKGVPRPVSAAAKLSP